MSRRKAGPTAVHENFTSKPSTVTPGLSWQVRWDLEFLGGDLKLWHNHLGTQDIGQGNAVRLNAKQGISVGFYKDLSIRLEYYMRYNSQPAEDRKSTDTTIIFGLGLDLLG